MSEVQLEIQVFVLKWYFITKFLSQQGGGYEANFILFQGTTDEALKTAMQKQNAVFFYSAITIQNEFEENAFQVRTFYNF